jgi:hypothetical protein
MRINEIINEDMSRRGFLKGAGAAAIGATELFKNVNAQDIGYAWLSAQWNIGKQDWQESSVDRWLAYTPTDPRTELMIVPIDKASGKPAGPQEKFTAIDVAKDESTGRTYILFKGTTHAIKWFRQKLVVDGVATSIFYVTPISYLQNKLGWRDMYHSPETFSKKLREGEAVNMSPYKEVIENAETPKKKAAKNKISELFND